MEVVDLALVPPKRAVVTTFALPEGCCWRLLEVVVHTSVVVLVRVITPTLQFQRRPSIDGEIILSRDQLTMSCFRAS